MSRLVYLTFGVLRSAVYHTLGPVLVDLFEEQPGRLAGEAAEVERRAGEFEDAEADAGWLLAVRS